MTLAAWLSLIGQVMAVSLLSVGGALTVAPELRRLLVDELGLLTSSQFVTSVALAQAAPGPNALYAAVLGYEIAGLPGAVVILAAFMTPTTALALAVARVGTGPGQPRAVAALKVGLAPISIAMLVATSWILVARAQAPAPATVSVALAAAVLAWRTRLHLLWMIGGGALLGALGIL
jgi:chromate transporter